MDYFVIEAAGVHIQPDNRGQHEDRGDHGVQEKLYCGVNAPAVSPNSDEQRHGNQRRFPEDIEEKQIKRQENANHCGFEHQEENKKFFYAIVD